MKLSLDLIFFNFFIKKVKKFKLSFSNIVETIEQDKIKISIPEKVFIHGKDKATISITLYDDSNNFGECKFNVYYGNNYAYIQTDRLSNLVYEIILQNMKSAKITEYGKIFNQLDNLGNNDRERLTLINYEQSSININEIDLNLFNIINRNTIESDIGFNQISVLSLDKKIFIVKPIKNRSEYDVNFFIEQKELLLKFKKDFNKFLNSSIYNYVKVRNEIYHKYRIIKQHGSLDLNRDDEYLNEIFNKNKFLDVELFFNYSLCIFFLDSETEFIYFNKNAIILCINKLENIKKELKKETNLSMYEKVRVIYTLFEVLLMKNSMFKNINELEKLNIRYLITSKKEENSIIDKCYKYYFSFVNSISEDSAIFPYLLNIDSGCGYYNKEPVYTFDLKNLNMIKSHLKQVFPQVIILCYIENGEVALTDSEFGGIIINEFYLTKLKNIDYNSSSSKIQEEQKDDIAMNLFLELIHEASGHKKYALSEEEVNSPKKIFNKNKKIITLKHPSEYVPDDNDAEYILTSDNNKEKGDSGHYLELCFGKYNNELIISILRNMEKKGKLIKYPELFTDDGKILQEYVTLRKKIEENNITINFKYETSIKDDIIQMKNELEKIQNINENINEKEPNSNIKLQNEYLNRKIKRDKEQIDNDNNNENKKKKYSLNYIKQYEGSEKVENKANNNIYEEKIEMNYNINDRESINIAKQKVEEKFKIDFKHPKLKKALINLQMKLDIDDPMHNYVSLLVSCFKVKF